MPFSRVLSSLTGLGILNSLLNPSVETLGNFRVSLAGRKRRGVNNSGRFLSRNQPLDVLGRSGV